MLFNSIPFLIFCVALLIIHRSVPVRQRRSVLLGASLFFYAMWIPTYLVLFLFVMGVNFMLLRAMGTRPHAKLHLVASITFSLLVLVYFKYATFLVSALIPALATLGLPAPPVPEILLPLGVSFYTFQIIALSLDTYRKEIEPVRTFREYMLFISFFPQLIAGPIVRGSQLLPQIREAGTITPEFTRRGRWLIALGLVKKVLVADLLLAPFVDQVYSSPGFGSAPEHLLAVYSFAFQIYMDFSGYTDMARGLALLLGFELPLNFKEPYLSRNPSEFWRRWHITLSLWLRDYLYISLGGNRRGRFRTHLNLMTTMILGGLWHGAGWNFLVWGVLHGVLLSLHRLIGTSTPANSEKLAWRDLPSVLIMFQLVAFTFIFFRADSFADATAVIIRIATGGVHGIGSFFQIGVIAFCVGFHLLERVARMNFERILAALKGRWGSAFEAAIFGTLAGLVALFGSTGGEFIYFQF